MKGCHENVVKCVNVIVQFLLLIVGFTCSLMTNVCFF